MAAQVLHFGDVRCLPLVRSFGAFHYPTAIGKLAALGDADASVSDRDAMKL